jgi:hemolysin D
MFRFRLFARPSADARLGAAIAAFESETLSVLQRVSPRSERAVLYVIGAMIGTSLLLMSVAKLDRVVSGTGRIKPTEGALFVQPLDKSIVRDIRVQAGDIVKKGEVLASLDPTFTAADVGQLEQKLKSSRAQAARLEAEIEDRPYRAGDDDPYALLQASIWRRRHDEFGSSLADFDARIRNIEASTVRYEQTVESFRNRLKNAADIEQMNVVLEKRGWGSRLKTLNANDGRLEAERQLSDNLNLIKESEQSALSLKSQRAVYVEKWYAEAGRDLAAVRETIAEAEEQMKKTRKLNELVTLEAPADSVVLKLGKASIGSVVNSQDQNAEPLITLVPLGRELEAEVGVNAQDIGFIRVGDDVQIKLDAYRYMEHGTAKGIVKTISEGSFTADEGNVARPPFFKVRVGLTDTHLRGVPETFRLIPGMTLMADIMVGRRTILSYLVEGGMRTGSEAMREP